MVAEMDALNYPYIRVRSADWLKRTLLIFPHVVRMTPRYGAPNDSRDIKPFCTTKGPQGPLLRAADLTAPHVQKAQRDLVREIQDHLHNNGEEFRKRFEKRPYTQSWEQGTVWERRLGDRSSFQIHRDKMLYDLWSFLCEKNLCWRPEGQSDGPDYLEMHPRLGEAIMATLADACAANEGLRVVTEFPDLHGKLVGRTKEAIFKSLIDDPEPSGSTSAEQIAELFVYQRCDPRKLTAQRLAALHEEREALAKFRLALEDVAKTLPPTILSDVVREKHLYDRVNDIFTRWQADRANFHSYTRELFDMGSLDEPVKFIQKIVETARAPVGGAVVFGEASHILLGAVGGLAVGLAYRALEAWGKIKRTEENSPFRYLTILEKNGVGYTLSR